MPSSPIRKLAKYADEAKRNGVHVYHLNIGQPDIQTPECALEAVRALDRTVLEYSPSQGYKSLRTKMVSYYAEYGIDLSPDEIIVTTGGSEAVMFARLEEVKHAKEEGIEFLTLHNPIEYLADETGAVRAVVLQKMELGEPDASGRRSPQPIPGATVTLDIDQAIVAVGVSPNPIVPTSIEGLELGRKNTIVVGENMQTNLPTIFAGGDIVRGGATVILAMGDGRRAAQAMHEYLTK